MKSALYGGEARVTKKRYKIVTKLFVTLGNSFLGVNVNYGYMVIHLHVLQCHVKCTMIQ
jgi:hypothetical protein